MAVFKVGTRVIFLRVLPLLIDPTWPAGHEL